MPRELFGYFFSFFWLVPLIPFVPSSRNDFFSILSRKLWGFIILFVVNCPHENFSSDYCTFAFKEAYEAIIQKTNMISFYSALPARIQVICIMKQFLQENLLYIYIYICIYVYIYVLIHRQTDCFVVLRLFNMSRHIGHFKLGSKPA